MGLTHDDKPQNLQDTFLNAVRKSKTPVTIYLVNGVKLQGNITWFDNFCVLLRRDGQVQLVYKHAISTVMPMGPVQLQEQEIAGRGGSLTQSGGSSGGEARRGTSARALVLHVARKTRNGASER